MASILAKSADRIVSDLVRSGIIEDEDRELYAYGIEQTAVIMINMLSAAVLGLLTGQLVQCALFFLCYIPLRSFAGGFHARTPMRCYIYSMIIVAAVLSILATVDERSILFTAAIPAACVILAFSPVEDENKPLDSVEKKRYRSAALKILVAELICGAQCVWADIDIRGMAAAIIVEAIMLTAGIMKNARLRVKYIEK